MVCGAVLHVGNTDDAWKKVFSVTVCVKYVKRNNVIMLKARIFKNIYIFFKFKTKKKKEFPATLLRI